MSLKIINLIFSYSKTRGAARLVMLAIADRANDQGMAWPGMADISRRAGVDERTARRAVRHAEQIGELSVNENGAPGGAGNNFYRITIKPEALFLTHEGGNTPGGQRAPRGGGNTPEKRGQYAPQTVREHTHAPLDGETCVHDLAKNETDEERNNRMMDEQALTELRQERAEKLPNQTEAYREEWMPFSSLDVQMRRWLIQARG